MKNKQIGFTLIELMISLALGLIVVAAAILLFLTGQKSVAMQKGVGELQDNANFGLNYITKDIRLTNLNITDAAINDRTVYGGIVLTSIASDFVDQSTDSGTGVVTKYPNLPATIVGLADTLLTQSNGKTSVGTGNVWTGTSNVSDNSGATLTSDQLVIQYLPQYTLDTTTNQYVGGFDCEGNELRFDKAIGLQMVIQRYFLRSDNNKASNESSPLALACDAGYYPVNTPTAILNYGGAGEIIMKRVDYFRVLLGVQFGNGTHRYLPVSTYMALTAPRPRILSVQLGALVRSTQAMGADSTIKSDQTFQVLDQTVKVKASTDPKYIRQVVSQTIALRNALGERE